MLSVAALVAAAPARADSNDAEIVVDGNTGRVIHESHADAPRYPASMTKMMTLYIVFEEMAAGRLSKSTSITFSQRAAGQPPSKLGLKPGETISLDNAIRALVTKSANDVATAVAEHIGGTEWSFAQRMTKTAQRIGMGHTAFRNASGLPNTEQKTTARDMMVLARRLQSDFPQYYPYFSVRKFTWKGHTFANHNHLLGRYRGTDGIKTGYTRASGYNLTASVERDDKRVIAVVMGGRTAGRRDAEMRRLLDKAFPQVVAYHAPDPAPRPRAKPEPIAVAAATPDPEPARTTAPRGAARVVLSMVATPPRNRELPLATPIDRPADFAEVGPAGRLVRLVPAGTDLGRALGIFPAAQDGAASPTARLAAAGPSGVAAFAADGATQDRAHIASLIAAAATPSPEERVAVRGKVLRPAAARAEEAPAVTSSAPQEKPRTTASTDWQPQREKIEIPDGWHLQVGAYAREDQAEDQLDAAKKAAKGLLANAQGFAMPVAKDSGTIYRARFAGLDKNDLSRACSRLKRANIDCIVVSQ